MKKWNECCSMRIHFGSYYRPHKPPASRIARGAGFLLALACVNVAGPLEILMKKSQERFLNLEIFSGLKLRKIIEQLATKT
jgi:hypothetical protein